MKHQWTVCLQLDVVGGGRDGGGQIGVEDRNCRFDFEREKQWERIQDMEKMANQY